LIKYTTIPHFQSDSDSNTNVAPLATSISHLELSTQTHHTDMIASCAHAPPLDEERRGAWAGGRRKAAKEKEEREKEEVDRQRSRLKVLGTGFLPGPAAM